MATTVLDSVTPITRARPAPAPARIEDLPAGLDWKAFSARCFPARGFPHGRRHDFKAVNAYFAYKQLPEKAAERKKTAEAVEAWEGEGGSTSASP
jgi:hypothetical protein